MKKFLSICLGSVVLAGAAFSFAACGGGADYNIGIVQYAVHDALTDASTGFQDKLNELMEAEGKTVSYNVQNAQGQATNSKPIVDTFIAKNVDLIYAIATPSAQTAAGTTSTIPVLFNAVTDPGPASAKLVGEDGTSGKNVSGVSDMNPMEKQYELMKELLGDTQMKLGILYTSSEPNSKTQADEMTAIALADGMSESDVVIATVTTASDIENALNNTLKNQGVNMVYIPTDNMLASAASTVHSMNVKSNPVPIVCGEANMNDLCGVATLAIDYYVLGELAAQMAFDVLVKGTDIGTIKYQTCPDDKLVYSVNDKVADEVSFTVPQSVYDKVEK